MLVNIPYYYMNFQIFAFSGVIMLSSIFLEIVIEGLVCALKFSNTSTWINEDNGRD